MEYGVQGKISQGQIMFWVLEWVSWFVTGHCTLVLVHVYAHGEQASTRQVYRKFDSEERHTKKKERELLISAWFDKRFDFRLGTIKYCRFAFQTAAERERKRERERERERVYWWTIHFFFFLHRWKKWCVYTCADTCVQSGGGFFFVCENFGRMFDNLFPACTFFKSGD